MAISFSFLLSSFLHQVEIKHQPESNYQHPEPLTHGSLPIPSCTEKIWCHFSLQLLPPLLLAPNLPVRELTEQTGKHHTMRESSNQPLEHKSAQLLGRLIPPPIKL
jgi:hypothetical protein